MSEELKIIITAQVDKLKQEVANAKKQVEKFTEGSKKGASEMDAAFKAMGAGIKNTLKVVGASIAAAGAALLALGASTQEYRNEQAKLTTAFESAGSSAETAKNTYNDLFRVLGDGGQATEAASHLAKLTTEEQALSEWTTICQGVYATFGASLPIESLTEASNETAKVGKVTGSLADALNWAGISEDDFNAKLEKCNSEAEREKLIRETLNKTYDDAAKKYEKNNAEVLKQNEAQAKLQDTTAKLGEAVAPVITLFTDLANKALSAVTPYIQKLSDKYLPKLEELLKEVGEGLKEAYKWASENKTTLQVLAGIIGGLAIAIGLYNAAAAVKAAIAAAEVATVWGLVTAYAAQAAAMLAALAPYALIVAAVAALVAGFLYLWNNCEGFRAFWIGLWEHMKALFAAFVESIKPLIQAIVDTFKEAWELIKVVWDIVKPYFQAIWEAIKAVFSVAKEILGGYFRVAWEVIKAYWSVATSYFTAIWNTIKGVFSVVKNVLSGNFKGAWDAIKGIFSNWGGFFKGLWNTVKSTFGNIAQTIGNAMSGTIKAAINGVLRTAVNIINGFISAINTAIKVLNAVPGVSIKKLNKLDVPKLAKGGIVDSATLSVIGEQGKEAVVPLENNTEWLDMLEKRLSKGNDRQIILQVDGKTFAQIAVNSINDLTTLTGNLPLKLA